MANRQLSGVISESVVLISSKVASQSCLPAFTGLRRLQCGYVQQYHCG